MLNTEEKNEIRDMFQEVMDANKPQKSAAERKAEIMAIKDSIQRQKAISENMDLFKGGN